MGYAITGYPTRGVKGRRNRDKRPRYLLHQDDGGTRNKRVKIDKKECVRHKLQDLPIEIIQRIFILSTNVDSMPILSRYFYHALRPSYSILHDLMVEKYSFIPLIEGGGCDKIPPGHILFTDAIFSRKIFFEFLTLYHENIMSRAWRIIPANIYYDYNQSRNPGLVTQWLDENHTVDYPEIFYQRIDVYFKHIEFVLYLKRFFTLLRPYFVIESSIAYFFREQDIYSVDTFFTAIKVIMNVSRTDSVQFLSPMPLIVLLENLYHADGLQGESHWEPTERYKKFPKFSFMKLFLENFYCKEESKEYLSDSALWSLLRKISDVQIIDLIVEYGGNPQYNVLI